jgi:ABC-type dipeptide/oligopeptide/nickel transport system permease component
LLVITALIYSLARSMPGDPLQVDMAEMDPKHRMSPEDHALAKKAYGLDKPWHVAYAGWLGGLFKLDLGDSFRYRRPVTTLIGERVGYTLMLSAPSFVVTFGLAIPLGLYVTRRSGRLDERLLSVFFYMLYSLPSYVVALWLLYYFYLRLSGTIFQLPPGMTSDNFSELSFLGKAATAMPAWRTTLASLKRIWKRLSGKTTSARRVLRDSTTAPFSTDTPFATHSFRL